MKLNFDNGWSRSLPGELYERWPKNEDGEPEKPVRLVTADNRDFFDELTISMLESCGIPCLRMYPGDGSFGKLILGMSGQGTDIYVPESMAEDAAALCDYKGDYEEEP